jgi:hypothetical protein
MPTGKSRTEQYKILEVKSIDRDNITFLEDSDIKITITNVNNCFLFYDRICELVNRSNRLNFTKTKFPSDDHAMMPYGHIQNRDNYAVFAWDKYGYYGLIGYFSTDEINRGEIEHFAFSCRILDMGIEHYCADYIKQVLKIPFNINITARDSSYIEHVDFDIARELISTKQELTFTSEEPKAILYAGCLSLPIWVNCETNYLLDPVWFHGRVHKINIENVPDLIIIGVMNELALPPESMTEYKSACEQFIKTIREHNKSVLLIFPDYLAPDHSSIEAEIYDFWKHIDVDSMSIPMMPNQLDHLHFTRYSLFKLAVQIDNWIIKKI